MTRSGGVGALAAGVIAAAGALGGAAGCLSRSEPEPQRYFKPKAASEAAGAASGARAGAAATKPAALRLRRVGAAGHLRDRIAFRTGDVEVGYNDLLRWTEPPAAYAERALGRELFEARSGAIARADAGADLVLDAELRAFECVDEPERAAVCAIWIALAPDGGRGAALIERTYAARRPLAAKDPEALARALGEALDEAARAVAKDVEAALKKHGK